MKLPALAKTIGSCAIGLGVATGCGTAATSKPLTAASAQPTGPQLGEVLDKQFANAKDAGELAQGSVSVRFTNISAAAVSQSAHKQTLDCYFDHPFSSAPLAPGERRSITVDLGAGSSPIGACYYKTGGAAGQQVPASGKAELTVRLAHDSSVALLGRVTLKLFDLRVNGYPDAKLKASSLVVPQQTSEDEDI